MFNERFDGRRVCQSHSNIVIGSACGRYDGVCGACEAACNETDEEFIGPVSPSLMEMDKRARYEVYASQGIDPNEIMF
jgi:hypothetical protein